MVNLKGTNISQSLLKFILNTEHHSTAELHAVHQQTWDLATKHIDLVQNFIEDTELLKYWLINT